MLRSKFFVPLSGGTLSRMVDRTVFFVVGMHRSATSALAGALIHAGLAGPLRPLPAAADNRRGTFEAHNVVDLNERLLGRACRQWFHCRPVPLLDPVGERAVAERILLEDFSTAPCIVVKDPRISLLLPFWLGCAQRVGMRPVVVIAVRTPAEVARSLAVRDGLARDHSIACWMRYMLDAERSSRGLPRVFVDTTQLIAHPERQILDILRHFGITDHATDVKRISGFVEAELLTRGGAHSVPVPPQAEEAAQIFSRLGTSEETAGDRARLDVLREKLDARGGDLDARLDRLQWATFRKKRPLFTWLGFRSHGIPRAWLRTILFQGGKTLPRRAFRRVVVQKNGALRSTFHLWVADHQPPS